MTNEQPLYHGLFGYAGGLGGSGDENEAQLFYRESFK